MESSGRAAPVSAPGHRAHWRQRPGALRGAWPLSSCIPLHRIPHVVTRPVSRHRPARDAPRRWQLVERGIGTIASLCVAPLPNRSKRVCPGGDQDAPRVGCDGSVPGRHNSPCEDERLSGCVTRSSATQRAAMAPSTQMRRALPGRGRARRLMRGQVVLLAPPVRLNRTGVQSVAGAASDGPENPPTRRHESEPGPGCQHEQRCPPLQARP